MRSTSRIGWLGLSIVLALSAWAASLDGQTQPGDKRLKLPSKKDQNEAAKIVLDVFGGDLDRVKETEDRARKEAEKVNNTKLALDVAVDKKKLVEAKKLENQLVKAKKDAEEARKLADDVTKKLMTDLLANARASKDDPANRYVLYYALIDFSAKIGEAKLALQTIDELAQDFAVDELGMKAVALSEVVKSNRLNVESAKFVVAVTKDLIDEALDADEFNVAGFLGTTATAAAKFSMENSLKVSVARLNEDAQAQQKAFKRIQTFIDRLKENPKDPEANLELGKYYGFVKVKWPKALPYLARGSDQRFAKLAADDLEESREKNKDVHKQLALGDGWWQLAEEAAKRKKAFADEADKKRKALAEEKKNEVLAEDVAMKNEERIEKSLLVQARYWYALAREGLSGLNLTKAQRRIDLIDLAILKRTELPLGPVGEIRKFLGHSEEVKSVAFSPEGRFAVSGGSDKTVRVWELASGREEKELTGHTKQVWSVAFHLTHRHVLSASWDTTVRLWDVATGRELRRFNHPLDVNGIALSRDGNTMLTGSDDHSVYLWNVQTGDQIRRFTGHTNFVYCVAFSPDGRHFASGGVDKTVRVWELDTGAVVRVFEGHANSVTNVAFTSDGRGVFSCGDTAAHLWDVSTGKEVRRFEHNKSGNLTNVLALAVSGDGRRLYTGGDDRAIRIWDTAGGKELQIFEGHTDSVTSLAVSADGNRLLSGSLDKSVRLWGLPR